MPLDMMGRVMLGDAQKEVFFCRQPETTYPQSLQKC